MVFLEDLLDADSFSAAVLALAGRFPARQGLPDPYQLGLVVPDVEVAAKRIEAEYDIGPFLILAGNPTLWIEGGEKRSYRGRIAIAYHEGFELELIEPGEGSDFGKDPTSTVLSWILMRGWWSNTSPSGFGMSTPWRANWPPPGRPYRSVAGSRSRSSLRTSRTSTLSKKRASCSSSSPPACSAFPSGHPPSSIACSGPHPAVDRQSGVLGLRNDRGLLALRLDRSGPWPVDRWRAKRRNGSTKRGSERLPRRLGRHQRRRSFNP